MIQITPDDFNIVCDAYDKGNIYHLAISIRDNKEDMFFIKVLELFKREKTMRYKTYHIIRDDVTSRSEGFSSEFWRWSWDRYNFYLLNKEETSPYIKKIILYTLEEKK